MNQQKTPRWVLFGLWLFGFYWGLTVCIPLSLSLYEKWKIFYSFIL